MALTNVSSCWLPPRSVQFLLLLLLTTESTNGFHASLPGRLTVRPRKYGSSRRAEHSSSKSASVSLRLQDQQQVLISPPSKGTGTIERQLDRSGLPPPTSQHRKYVKQKHLKRNGRKKNPQEESTGENTIIKSIQRNKKIVALGKQQQWKDILALYEQESSEFSNVNYATTMSQLQRIKWFDKNDPIFLDFVNDLSKTIERRGFDWIGIREIATILHAIGKMQLRTVDARQIVEFACRTENANALVSSGNTQAMSMICWSMASLEDSESFVSFLQSVTPQIDVLVENGKPQDVINMALACATLNVTSPKLFGAIDRQSARLVGDGTPQEVAMIARAFAVLNVPSTKFLGHIEEQSERLVEHGSPEAVAKIAWAFAKLGVLAPTFFREIEERSVWLAENGRAEAVTKIAWAFDTLGMQPPKAFLEIKPASKTPATLISAIGRNKKIIFLGKQQEWKELLMLHKQESQDFNNVNYAATISQLGRIQSVNKRDPLFIEFMDTLEQVICDRGLAWIGIREIATIIHAIGKMQLRMFGAKRIIEFVSSAENAEAIVSSGDQQTVSNICWSMAALGDAKNFASFILHVEADIHTLLDDPTPQGVSNMVWASATLGVQSPRLCGEINRRPGWLLQQGDCQAVSNTAWAVAKLGVQSPELFREIELQSDWLVENGSPQQVANIAWAFATLDVPAPNFFREIEKRAAWLVENGIAQEVANTAWAFARLGVRSPALFSEIEKRSKWLVRNGNPQAIANTAWASATLRLPSHQLFREIEKQASWLVDNGNTQEASNTVWAFATLGIPAPNLCDEIDQRSSWLLENGTTQGISNVAWAFATLGFSAPMLLAKIEERSSWVVENGTTQSIANIAWACATIGGLSPNLFLGIAKRSSWLIENGTSQEVANAAWAFATIGARPFVFFDSLRENFEKFLRGSGSQSIVNVCYSLAVLDLTSKYQEELLQLWSMALDTDPEEFPTVASTQLAQVYAFATAAGMKLQKPQLKYDKGVIPTSSRAQLEISQLLAELGFSHEQEVSPFDDDNSSLVPEGMLSIDIACRERMIAIEFDGPGHFLVDTRSGEVSTVENGATKAKRRFLQRLGWTVFNISYFDWQKVNGKTKKEKKALLLKVLNRNQN